MGHLPSQVVEVPSLGGFAPTLGGHLPGQVVEVPSLGGFGVAERGPLARPSGGSAPGYTNNETLVYQYLSLVTLLPVQPYLSVVGHAFTSICRWSRFRPSICRWSRVLPVSVVGHASFYQYLSLVTQFGGRQTLIIAFQGFSP